MYLVYPKYNFVYPMYNPDSYMTYDIPRYLGLFGDHIVQAVLYTQILPHPDLSSKGKPLITKARLETVWTRLADRLSTVVSDMSMITISPEYAGHFYDLYIIVTSTERRTQSLQAIA